MTRRTLAFAEDKLAAGQRVAWLTVTATRGSSPAMAGQVMAVAEDGETSGTIGGGASEHQIVRRALEAIAASEQVFSFQIDHAQSGMTCGGGMEGFGNVLGQAARLVIFGGGHIAQALAPMAAATGFSLCVVEDRPELAASFDGVTYTVARPVEFAEKAPLSPRDYVVIATRGHATDGEALRYALGGSPAYIGMIGSRRKVLTLMQRLREEGVPGEALSRVYAPIGLAIATGRPAEIAVSILAELLLIKNQGSPAHLRDQPPGEKGERDAGFPGQEH